MQSDSGGSRAVSGSESGARPLSRVVSSSCHDVTILALLYAMEAHLIVSEALIPCWWFTSRFISLPFSGETFDKAALSVPAYRFCLAVSLLIHPTPVQRPTAVPQNLPSSPESSRLV